MELAQRMGCHQRADRSYAIGKYQFPLCARCTGIFLSSIAGYAVYFKKKPKLSTGMLLVIPMAVDGTMQLAGIKESTNARRLFTGMLGGAGLVFIRLNLYRMLFSKIKRALLKAASCGSRDCQVSEQGRIYGIISGNEKGYH